MDGLLAKEFYPENLQDHAIIPYNAPQLFWEPEGERQYFYIKQLLSPFIQTVGARLVNYLIEEKYYEFNDPQAIRWYAYQDRFARFIQFEVTPTIRRVLGRNVIPSYIYFGGYVAGSFLEPHTDRPACEYSMSVCMDHFPPGSTWRLALERYSRKLHLEPLEEGGDGMIPEDESRIAYAELQPGDSFIFQGRHKVHWRDGTLPQGHFSRLFFFHFVHEDFPGSLT